MNPFVQSDAADTRFLTGLLVRHGGIAPALAEIQKLRDAHPSGRLWWVRMESQLSILLAEGQVK